MTNNKPSQKIQDDALKVAKATQRPSQTKEQTKLIAQGIEKGIAEYKKQQNKKMRERDKERKQELKRKQAQTQQNELEEVRLNANSSNLSAKLPWVLLILSWAIMAAYLIH